ncbi:MAG: GDSL-type esterase/lipase family protein [Candidatus Zixiibacteriota bacterium]
MFKKISLTVVVFLLFFLVLEMVCHFLESRLTASVSSEPSSPGWQTEFFSSLFDWHEPDPVLLWRFKPNLNNPLIKTNSAHFIGEEVSKKKDPRTYRIMVLGDSSPVGLGLDSCKQAFAEILQVLLNQQYPGKEIEVVNAAVSGYTSEQVTRFMDSEGWSYAPDLVLVYCGNNDASVSGDRSDRELMRRQQVAGMRQVLSRLAFYRVLRDVITGFSKADNAEPGILNVRVTPEQYEENLRQLARQAHGRNCSVIVIKPAVPYLWPAGLQFKIFTHVTGDEGRLILPPRMVEILGRQVKYCLDENRFRSLYGRGDKFTRAVYASAYNDGMSPEQAVAFYERLLADDSGNAVICNNLGVSWWAEGDFDRAGKLLRKARALYCENLCPGVDSIAERAAGSPFLYNLGINLLTRMSRDSSLTGDRDDSALIYLDSALQADFFSLRIKKTYWRAIDKLKAENLVEILELPALFGDNGSERLFIDHCHPTIEGHRLIAGALFDKIVASGFIRP